MVLSRRIKAVVDVFVVVHLRGRQSVTVYSCLRHEGTSANCANTKSRAGIPKRASASRCDPSSPVLQHHIFSSLRIASSRTMALLHGHYSWACSWWTPPLINIPSRSPSITHSSPSWIPPHANHFPRLEERQWRSNPLSGPHLLDRVEDGGPAGPWSSVAAFLCFFFRVSFGLCQ